jgi:hypothetical protein
MKQACKKEIDKFCKDVPHGNARVIRWGCLRRCCCCCCAVGLILV